MTPFRILHAENDRDQAGLLGALIHKILGTLLEVPIEIRNVTTLKEALELTHDHDATIFDLHLDDAGEDEVIEAFKHCREPIVVMTGVDDAQITRRCEEAGATRVFVKMDFDAREFCLSLIQSFKTNLEIEEASA